MLVTGLCDCDGLADAASCGAHRAVRDWPGPLWRLVVEAPAGTRVHVAAVEDNRDTPYDLVAPDTVLLVGDRIEAYAEAAALPAGTALRLRLDNQMTRWTPTNGCRWETAPAGWASVDAGQGRGVVTVDGLRMDPPFDLWRYGAR